jgi:FkbM family methyltransferase
VLFRSYARARSFPAATVTSTLDGNRFHVSFDHLLEWRLFAWGHYEGHVRAELVSRVSAGDTCIDVGANIGVHAVALARAVGPTGRVVAIEADPAVADRLDANVLLNGLENVRVVRAAAHATSGLTLGLNTTPPSSRSHAQGSLLRLGHLTGSVVAVPTLKVDDLGLRDVRLVKVDVEGAEWDVLQGALTTLERDHPTIVFEFNRSYSPRPFDDYRALLAAVGYQSIFEIPDPSGRVMLSPQPLISLSGSDPAAENANVLAC